MSKIFNLIFVITLALLVYWGYGYNVAKKQGEISLEHYIQSNIDINQQKFQNLYSKYFDKLDTDIKTDDRIKRGAINELSRAISIYQAENDQLPAKEMLDKVYRDARGILKDPAFIYSTSTDNKHFEISIKLKTGEVFKMNR